jgi:ADP-ribose pyrophosphatase
MSEYFKFSKPRWNVSEDTKLLETPIFSLHQIDLIPDKSDKPAPFYVLNAPEWINVIALTADQEIVLVEQYRAGIHDASLEIPGGMVDQGEEPIEAAKRELLEETGYHSDEWISLGKASANPAIMSNYTHFYLAENCRCISDQQTDGFEDIRVHLQSLDQFFRLVDEGIVHHSVVLAAVAKYVIRNHVKH